MVCSAHDDPDFGACADVEARCERLVATPRLWVEDVGVAGCDAKSQVRLPFEPERPGRVAGDRCATAGTRTDDDHLPVRLDGGSLGPIAVAVQVAVDQVGADARSSPRPTVGCETPHEPARSLAREGARINSGTGEDDLPVRQHGEIRHERDQARTWNIARDAFSTPGG